MYSHVKDAAVLMFTVATCTFLLTAAYTLGQPRVTLAEITPVLALPQSPGVLELVPEPELALLETDAISDSPPLDVASVSMAGQVNLAEIEAVSMMSLAPDDSIPFHGIIVQAAGRYAVDPHLIRAIILAESGYNPNAESKKGARGLMQLMPLTAKSLGVNNVYDPEENIDGGVRYFRSLLDRFDGDVQLALAAYNAGSRHVRNYEGIPPFKATQRYVKKVLKFQEKFKMENLAGIRRLA